MLAWSHIYLGRMLDLECKRDQALAEYKEALAVRDGQLDTRLAAERGVKAAYVQRAMSTIAMTIRATMLPSVTSATRAQRAGRCWKPDGAATAKPESPAQDSAPKPQ